MLLATTAILGDALHLGEASLVVVLVSGLLSIIGSIIHGYLSVSLEHRLTKIETKLESLPCGDCQKKHEPLHCQWHKKD